MLHSDSVSQSVLPTPDFSGAMTDSDCASAKRSVARFPLGFPTVSFWKPFVRDASGTRLGIPCSELLPGCARADCPSLEPNPCGFFLSTRLEVSRSLC